MSILQMRKLRHREAKQLTSGNAGAAAQPALLTNTFTGQGNGSGEVKGLARLAGGRDKAFSVGGVGLEAPIGHEMESGGAAECSGLEFAREACV